MMRIMLKNICLSLLCLPTLFGTVERSVIPLMDAPPQFLEGQISCTQERIMSCGYGIPLRVISFNMLSDRHDRIQERDNRWPIRKYRVLEYIKFVHPDIIGTQELEPNQAHFLEEELGSDYGFFGKEVVIYNKRRVKPICERLSNANFTVIEFEELANGAHFTVINTHLNFGSVEKRLAEARALQNLIKEARSPVIVTGDMNTFPMRPELSIPFYDGDYIMQVIEEGGVRDARKLAVKGHYGLISSTNFSNEEMREFSGDGEPGVILDHIFVSPRISVRTHAIDPARVDGLFTSDHFPVIADVVICP